MKKIVFVCLILCAFQTAFSQTNTYDEKLAKSLGADDYGMRNYVFCLLKSGSNTTASKEETSKAFQGHMANIGRLAKEGKLVVAGPFMNNDRNYRGIFIFNVPTIEEAKKLVDTDPAVQAKLLDAELTLWYSSAALIEISKIHEQIAKNKF